MLRYFKNWHLPRHLEIVGLLIVGMLLQMMDGSPFTMRERWKVIWDTDLPPNHFNPFVQKIIKTLLSVIVTVRCTTTYVYVVSAMLVVFCIFKRMVPKLMCLWLLVASVKPISTIFLEGLIGVYVCSAFGKIRKPCVEFFIVKALELIFATYLWGNVLNIYKDIEKELEQERSRKEEDLLFKKRDFRLLRARSLIDESTLSKTTYFNNFERRDVPMLILQMLKRDEEMSDDSLLAPGMMLASVSNLGSFDNIKTSQSLGELGFTDLTNAEVFGIEDNENLSKEEKVLKFLKLSSSEVRNIILNKTTVGSDIYNVSDDIWKRVVTSGWQIHHPKQPRTEIFIRTVSPTELSDEDSQQADRETLPFRSILSILLNDKKDSNEREDEDDMQDVRSQDEDEDGDQIFMSNLKDGSPINRIKMGSSPFTRAKGREYARLYKKDFMSHIGPEVFDKASKLQKLTSLTRIRALTYKGPRSSPDLPRKKSKRLRTLDQEAIAMAIGLHEKKDHGKNHANDHLSEDKPNFSPTRDSSENDNNEDSSENGQQRDQRNISFFLKQSQNAFKAESEMAIQIAASLAERMKMEGKQAPDMKEKDEEAVPVNLKDAAIPETKLGDKEAAEVKAAEEKPPELKLTEEKPPEPKLIEEKPPEVKLVEEKPSEPTSVEGKSAEKKSKNKKASAMKQLSLGGRESLLSRASVEERTRPKEEDSIFFAESVNAEETKPGSTNKNRRILIRWVGQSKPKFLFRNRLSGNRSPSDESDTVTDPPTETPPEPKTKDPDEPRGKKRGKTDDPDRVKPKKFNEAQSNQTFYVSEIFRKPLFNVLLNYYDLKRRVYLKGRVRHQKDKLGFSKLTRGKSRLKEAEKLSKNLGLWSQGEKNWKSEVLKRSELGSQVFSTPSVSFLSIFNKRAAIKKLLVHEYNDLVQRYNRFNETKDDFGFTSPDENNAETASDDSENSSETESDSISSLDGTTDSAESGFLQVSPSNELKEFASEVLDTELQYSDRPYAEDGDIPSDGPRQKTGPGVENRAVHPLAKEEGQLLSSQESDEPISLYYSKAANLASPLLDMKGFIYPDHIHYSYKHVKKKGFDVDINGGFPLLMRGSLAMGGTRAKVEHKWEAKNQDCEITSRPMDLSFATTNAFFDWNSADQNDSDSITSETILAAGSDDSAVEIRSEMDLFRSIEIKGGKDAVGRRDNRRPTKNDFKKAKPKSQEQNSNDLKCLYQSKDTALIKKLLKMHMKLNAEEYGGSKENTSVSDQRSPVLVSPTRLHSNKGRLSSSYKTAAVLQENRTNNEKTKSETQYESAKDLFVRLEGEALLQNEVFLKSYQHPSFEGDPRKP